MFSHRNIDMKRIAPSREIAPPTGRWAFVRRPSGKSLLRLLFFTLLGLWIILGLHGSIALPHATPASVDDFVAGRRFDIVAWEIDAILERATANLRYPAPTLAHLDGSFYVNDYLILSSDIRQIERDIEAEYAVLPTDASPTAHILELEETLARLRQQQDAMQPRVETIIERQVARTIQRQGLTTAGVVWPPVLFRLTAPPLHLVISPRDRIELITSRDLRPDLSLTEREELEAAIDQTLDVSSLVENLGGYGAYPSLVLEYASLTWLTNTVVHEWIHNYLVFYPLGRAYSETPAMSTLNETVASLVGDELGALVIEYYYPWITPPALSWQKSEEAPADEPAREESEPEFDYGAFMRVTRLEADRLLAKGDIAGAEQYMEERRQELLRHGYVIRKLNQAYFAFHGLYATSPGAVDPTGPKMERLRRQSSSLRSFMETVQTFRAPADLDAALSQ
jgi:hypothetical protein